MTSQVNVDTIAKKDGTSAVATEYVTGGSAKAWVRYNGQGTVAINGSLNFSSMTDVGTGNYSFTFTNSMNSTDDYTHTHGDNERGIGEGNVASTSSFSLFHRNQSFSVVDISLGRLAAHGDLA